MAVEQLLEALPLHYLQHGISRFGAANVALAVFVTAALAAIADYAWMLYLRSKMVRTASGDRLVSLVNLHEATWAISIPHYW